MHGHPRIRFWLVVALFAALGWPVWGFTRPAATPPGPPPAAPALPPATAATSLRVELTFAPAPVDFTVSLLGKPFLGGRDPGPTFAGTITAALPKEGVDLAVQVRWPPPVAPATERAPAAVRVTVSGPDGPRVTRSFWSQDPALTEIVTVPAFPPPADAAGDGSR